MLHQMHYSNQPGKISYTRYVLFYSEAHGMVWEASFGRFEVYQVSTHFSYSKKVFILSESF